MMYTKEAASLAAAWTIFVRLTHWLVAFCVVINFFNESGFWHRLIGYCCVGLVFLRIAYGLWISKVPSSRLYIPTIVSIKRHLIELATGQTTSHVGHNPLGQWAVYVMWLLIALLALTGWLSRTDAYWGEDWPVDLHAIFSNALQSIVVLHLLAIVVMSKLQKKNLVKAMICSKQTIADE